MNRLRTACFCHLFPFYHYFLTFLLFYAQMTPPSIVSCMCPICDLIHTNCVGLIRRLMSKLFFNNIVIIIISSLVSRKPICDVQQILWSSKLCLHFHAAFALLDFLSGACTLAPWTWTGFQVQLFWLIIGIIISHVVPLSDLSGLVLLTLGQCPGRETVST
jgi:hypothetical protein